MNHLVSKAFTVYVVQLILIILIVRLKPILTIVIEDASNHNLIKSNTSGIVNHHQYHQTCYLPNQTDIGYCVVISECQAYQKVKNFTDLTARNVNFLKRVQCQSATVSLDEITKVCCPKNGTDYSSPQIEFSVNHRARILVGGKAKKFKRRIDIINTRNNITTANTNINNPTTIVDFADTECGKQITNRIYGGEIAELDEYPWLALIFYNTNEFGCSGALINNQFILTAAHCVTGPIVREKKGLKHIRLGEFNVKTQPDCIEEIDYVNCADAALDVGIDQIIVHPEYNERSLNKINDIALIKLKKYVTFTHFIMPICLPNKDETDSPLVPGQFFSVSGWGKTDLFNKFFLNIRSPIKLKLRVPLVSRENCSEVLTPYGANLGPKQICAGGELAKDTCAGDSGGPLMHFDSKLSRWVTYGIVSYGFTQCGLAGHPAVYTNVVDYIDWITKTIAK